MFDSAAIVWLGLLACQTVARERNVDDRVWTDMRWYRNIVRICDGDYKRAMLPRVTFLKMCMSVARYLIKNGI